MSVQATVLQTTARKSIESSVIGSCLHPQGRTYENVGFCRRRSPQALACRPGGKLPGGMEVRLSLKAGLVRKLVILKVKSCMTRQLDPGCNFFIARTHFSLSFPPRPILSPSGHFSPGLILSLPVLWVFIPVSWTFSFFSYDSTKSDHNHTNL